MLKQLYINGKPIKSLALNGGDVWHEEDKTDYFSMTPVGDWLDIGVVKSDFSTIEALEEGDRDLQYSFDKFHWVNWNLGQNVHVNENQTIYVRGNNDKWYYWDEFGTGDELTYNFYFYGDGEVYCDGNIMTLLDKTGQQNYVPTEAFCYAPFYDAVIRETTQKIIHPPKLPAVEVGDFGYFKLFEYCDSLSVAPELPALTIGVDAYDEMFKGCSSLSVAPELPAVETPEECYYEMFYGCNNIISARIGAKEISSQAQFFGMFRECTKLSCVDVDMLKIWDRQSGWLQNVSPTGIFRCYSQLDTSIRDSSHIPVGWDIQYKDMLCFTAEQANSTIKLATVGNISVSINLKYSRDNLNWSEWDYVNDTLTLTNIGDKVYVKASTENTKFYQKYNAYCRFQMTGKIAASGNIMFLLSQYGSMNLNRVGDYAFMNLFKDCKSLTQAPELPALSVGYQSYCGMFYNCNSLSIAPELPAMALNLECYCEMFENCTSLTQAPELPATELADCCYQAMFKNCFSLTSAPELPALIAPDYCYYGMFAYCESLSTPPVLPATTISEGCYSFMFYNCHQLTAMPELPALTMAMYCYDEMFSNCYNLISTHDLPATELADMCYQLMFESCTSLTQAPAICADVLAYECCIGTFFNCTSLTSSPDLTATQLAEECYSYMFYACTALSTPPALPTLELADYCYLFMFFECTSLTSAPELPATELNEGCYDSMFQGCSNLQLINVHFTDWNEDLEPTWNWCDGVSESGTFICPSSLDTSIRDSDHIPTGFQVQTF